MSPDRNTEASLETAMKRLGAEAREAAALLAHCEAARKTEALQRAAEAIRDEAPAILEANRRDMAAAKDLSAAMTDRLLLDEKRIAAMAQGLAEVAALPDPIGTTPASSPPAAPPAPRVCRYGTSNRRLRNTRRTPRAPARTPACGWRGTQH